MAEATKRCTKCRAEKPLADFYAQPECRGGRRPDCKTCFSAAAKARRAANPEPLRNRSRAYYAANRERCIARAVEWGACNPECRKRYRSVWQQANPHKGAAASSRYLAAKLNATPLWADEVEIARVYEAAAAIGYDVDHIVPLQSPIVCGLHWEANLRPFPPGENRSKSNRYWPDMP